MKKLIVLVLLLAGCSDIDYHTMPLEDLQARFGFVNGYAEWGTWGCDIYLAPPETYPSEECYYAVVGHEERHCRDGAWHAGPYVEPSCNTETQ